VSKYKTAYLSVFIATIVILSAILRNLLSLGYPSITYFAYASYQSTSLLNIGNFLSGVQALVSINFFVGDTIKACICMLFACKGLASIFNIKDYRILVTPVVVFTFTLSLIVYKNSMEMGYFLTNIYPFYVIPFLILIPVAIWITALIRSHKQKKQKPEDSAA
jgi:spore germination protein KB